MSKQDNIDVNASSHAELDSDEPLVMGGRIRLYLRVGIRTDQFGLYFEIVFEGCKNVPLEPGIEIYS